MKTKIQKETCPHHLLISSAAALLMLCAAGCQTSGYRKGDDAALSLRRAANDVQAESRAIETTVEALNDLVQKPAADLKPQFRYFSTSLDHLEKTAARAERTRAQMEAKGYRYFDTWEKEMADIHYGIVRDQSESRKAAVTNQFHSVNNRYVEAQGVVRPLISYFNDIRTALSVDLTAAGLESVKGIVENANQNARKVQTALTHLSDELVNSGNDWASTRVRNPVPTEEARTSVAR